MTAPALALTGVEFRYEDSPWALRGLTLTVEAGEVFGIIGPNGSGKSSVLKLMGRLLTPQAGRLELLGRPLDRLSHAEVAETVAYVAQDQAQWFPYTVAEIVLMGRYPRAAARRRLRPLAVWGWEDDEDRRIAAWAMEQTDVAHLAARSIQEVSGGERQRAMLACALAQEPRVLLLDEPTAFLDLSHQVDIARILRRQHEATGLTVILVSHDLNLAAQYCDRILLLDEGRAARIGTPAEVIRPDALAAVYRCAVLVDPHPGSGLPRVTLPGRERSS